jgi:hypothetical protein
MIQFIEGEAVVALFLAVVTMTTLIIWLNRH